MQESDYEAKRIQENYQAQQSRESELLMHRQADMQTAPVAYRPAA